MYFKHFAGKNQLPGFYLSGTLVENELRCVRITTVPEAHIFRFNLFFADLINSLIFYGLFYVRKIYRGVKTKIYGGAKNLKFCTEYTLYI